MIVEYEKRVELEKMKIEQRTEQMMREKKEKTQYYMVQKVSEQRSNHINETKTKRQMKLPQDDMLYLNHDFDNREDFEAKAVSSLLQSQISNQRHNKQNKVFHSSKNYNHVQSVVGSKKNESEINSKKSSTCNLSDTHHNTDISKTHSQSDLKVGGMFRTRKLERRKSIEAKYTNPLERDLMESMEREIELLTETLAMDSIKNLDIPKPLEKVDWRPKHIPEIGEMYRRSLNNDLYKEHDDKMNNYLNNNLDIDRDELNNQTYIRREPSPSKNITYQSVQKSRSSSPLKIQQNPQIAIQKTSAPPQKANIKLKHQTTIPIKAHTHNEESTDNPFDKFDNKTIGVVDINTSLQTKTT